MGLGHFGGGVAAARWLASQGAVVTVTDVADEQALADSLKGLAGSPIARLHLGGHRDEDFRQADVVVANPAVRPGNPFVQLAKKSGARITTEIELFVEACQAPIIGVTGSNGKSTTAAMIAAVLRAQGRIAWLGGNIGRSLLDELPRISAEHWVVLELSSFQLWHMNPETPMPYVAVITGCTPNHLDWHTDFSEYVAAKQRMLIGQQADDLAVLNTFDVEAASWAAVVRGRLLPLYPLERLPKLAVPGAHNQVNAACAAAAALGARCGEEAIQKGLAGFRGLPQRLEWFAVVDGRRFYNDSTATTPESTMVALEAIEGPLWLLAGGHDKGFDYGPLAAAIARRVVGAAFFGSARELLHRQVAARNPQLPLISVETMREALDWCWKRSRPGHAIVLSPACSSHDQFRNFRERGEQFVEMVTGLA
jgi:UDP-N-acetylmuramoylalanine--D-glutamate ligase